ncbi:MAG TPA: 2-phosphosulfolactate phosphatase [Bacteroidales bacterium]|nr:2-phosphosulfolactate phosphatase [Bacteroidales bacterium]
MSSCNLEVCFSPAVFNRFENREAIIVIIDVLRASSAICNAFANGAETIIPVSEVEEARKMKAGGYLVAAERDGYVLEFADFGNSPFNFTREKVAGRTIAYSTTNGTRIIGMASSCHMTVIGAFLNMSALSQWLAEQGRDVVLFCAGWKDKFNLEDTICAGAIAEQLIRSGAFATICDSVHASIDLWQAARPSPLAYIQKAAQRSRLRDKGLDDCIEFCLTPDTTDIIPVIINGELKGTRASELR